MVKLRVTARVIPEEAYLAAIEASSRQGTAIRGERKFYVIVREPEEWYIGTLALEIKKNYARIYKHDLGQIKYLKDDADDCDLDPELYVADALVDEGRALKDPSDQHVTIKVIQEQGRDIRQGSIVPDLSQIHYQLPERTRRPPVPTFNDVGSSLGKRKPTSDIMGQDDTQKRLRLNAIEEDTPIASIERGQVTSSDMVIAESQYGESRSDAAQYSNTRNQPSPDLSWPSRRDVYPAIVEESSQERQDVSQGVVQNEDSGSVEDAAQTNQEHSSLRTPGTGSKSTLNPKSNGVSTVSPLAAASSASKKFLKPRKGMFAGPDSDIDDSQMSPNSKDTSRITPRLVPRKTSANGRLSSTQDENDALPEQNSRQRSQDIRQNSGSLTQGSTGKANGSRSNKPVSSHDTFGREQGSAIGNSVGTGPDATELDPMLVLSDGPSMKNSQSSAANNILSNAVKHQSRYSGELGLSKHDEIKRKESFAGSRMSLDPAPKHTNQNTLLPRHVSAAIDFDDDSSEAASKTSDATDAQSSRGRRRKRTMKSDDKNVAGNTADDMAVNKASSKTQTLKPKQVDKAQTSRTAAQDVHTPPPDSPSEQLSLALQESARKSMARKTTKTDASGTMRDGAVSVHKRRRNNKVDGSQQAPEVASPSSKIPAPLLPQPDEGAKVVQKITSTDANGSLPSEDNATKQADSKNLSVLDTAQPRREMSSESHSTNTSKTILPKGMTQEEYDRLVKAHSNVTLKKPKTSTKEISTSQRTPLAENRTQNNEQATTESEERAKDISIYSSPSTSTPTISTATKKKVDKAKGLSTNARSEQPAHTGTKSTPASTSKPKTLGKTPTLLAHESTNSTKSATNSVKTPSIAASDASVSKKSRARSSSKITATGQTTPTISTISKKPALSNKQAGENQPASTSKDMPPPSSSSINKGSVVGTPTPQPRASAPVATSKPTKPTLSQPTKSKAPSRPVLPPSYSTARTLQELREMAKSASNSTAGSPAPSTSRFAQPKKSLLNASSSDEDSDSESSSDDSSDNKPVLKASNVVANKTVSSVARSIAHPKSRPDPTIRDETSDDDESDD